MVKDRDFLYQCTECSHEMYGRDLEWCEMCLHTLKKLNEVNLREEPMVAIPRLRAGPGRVCLDK